MCMAVNPVSTQTEMSDSGSNSSFWHPVFHSPYGYVIGILLWPLNLFIFSVWGVLSLSYELSPFITVERYLFLGVFVSVSVTSALVMCVTASNTSYDRIQHQSAFLLAALLLAVPFLGLFDTWPAVPYAPEMVGLVGDTIANELFRFLFLGPAVGLAFLIVPLVVLGYRYTSEIPSTK